MGLLSTLYELCRGIKNLKKKKCYDDGKLCGRKMLHLPLIEVEDIEDDPRFIFSRESSIIPPISKNE